MSKTIVRAGVVVALPLLALALSACQLVFPTVEQSGSDAAADGPDGQAVDAGPFSFGNWSIYGLSVGSAAYSGGTFDGRFVYFAPYPAAAAQYDTHGDFLSPRSWKTFATKDLDDGGGPGVFSGAAFDGHYVYFVSNDLGFDTHAVFVRYNTKVPFDSTSSWQTFDATAMLGLPPYMSFSGATFDGKRVYFTPSFFSIALSFDTSGPFDDKASWTSFDVSALGKKAAGLHGAIFDGKYVYMVPFANYKVLDAGADQAKNDGLMLRYDTGLPFDVQGSWSAVDLATLIPFAQGYMGGAFDGRYVYLAPFDPGTPILRYDTRASLTDRSSFSALNPTSLNGNAFGFQGAAFDGRYVYFVPHENGAPDGLLARYDTHLRFLDKHAWSVFDMATLNPSAVGFWGAVFDGEYLYFVPSDRGVVARLRARTPRQMPKLLEFHGSFY